MILVIIAGGYVGNMLGVFNEGNYGEYSLKDTASVFDSPICGKTVIFLGSSVTFGQVHHTRREKVWWGPGSWRTQGNEWTYEYSLWPQGVMKSPELYRLSKK